MLHLWGVPAQRDVFSFALATVRSAEDCRRRLALRPGGTPQDISRGQVRVSGRSPRLPRRTRHAPAGHRRIYWPRADRSFSAPARRLGQIASPVSGVEPGPFLRCPAGARSHLARCPGAASAGADLPPANLLRRPSGTGTGRPAHWHRETIGAGMALQTRSIPAALLCVHRVSVVNSVSRSGVPIPPPPCRMNTKTPKWLRPVPYPCPSVSIRGFNFPSPSVPHHPAA